MPAVPGGLRRRLGSAARFGAGWGGWGGPARSAQTSPPPTQGRWGARGGHRSRVGARLACTRVTMVGRATARAHFGPHRARLGGARVCALPAAPVLRSPEAGIVLIRQRFEPHARPWRRAAGGSCGPASATGRPIAPPQGGAVHRAPRSRPPRRAQRPPSQPVPISRLPGTDSQAGTARPQPHRPHAARALRGPRRARSMGPMGLMGPMGPGPIPPHEEPRSPGAGFFPSVFDVCCCVPRRP